MRIVRIAQAHLEHLALHLGLEADAHELLLDLVTLRHADDHVLDQRAVESVHRTVAGLVRGTGHDHGGRLRARVGIRVRADLYFDIRVHLLAQRPEWPFHAYRIVGCDLHGHAGRQVYR